MTVCFDAATGGGKKAAIIDAVFFCLESGGKYFPKLFV